ncbi:Aste57867_721 [Aphanomyces stellatus]|uniref:Aste57867_721 protein n=1 Tax=Aphanomyces stellatus TaxID=120398 RepID=A0A485K5Z9_9STRA|nr:hypothetical protein As57867_000720 [Aphanomyces stellatus]VFT77945.1 Aste57867_721 [Aphanomyces stellatus]
MSATLNKLSALLDGGTSGGSVEKPAFEPGVACHFTAVREASVLDRLHLKNAKGTTHLGVQINTGMVTVGAQSIHACDLHIRIHGKKDVFLVLARGVSVPYTFPSRLFAVEFMGAVHLVQHLEALKSPAALPHVTHDAMLKEQMACTLEFAKEMWTLALWNQLYPYCGLVDSLRSASDFLARGLVGKTAMALQDVYQQFYVHTAITKVADGSRDAYYRASHMTLLVAKVKALQLHLALYYL